MNISKQRKERSIRLKLLRLNSGLSQMGLASVSGLQQCTISKIERGETSWSIDTELIYITAIADFLNPEL